MVKVTGIHFKNAGKVYYFDPDGLDIAAGQEVIVETARGIEIGKAISDIHEVPEDQITQPLKRVIRVATEEDKAQEAENRIKEQEALKICKEKIFKHELEMKLVGCEYTFDRSKVLFYFTAEGRVDFRELVKDLASIFRTRIELRQIGVRDETKMIGGIGVCGRPLCCTTYLTDFSPVSIKMAKEQGLSLNPTKVSGVCGRLMCCLNNEEETYEYLNSKLPNKGEIVLTPEGNKGVVSSLNVLRQKVKVIIENDDDEKEVREYDVEDLRFAGKHKEAKVQSKPEQAKEKPEEKADKDIKADNKPERISQEGLNTGEDKGEIVQTSAEVKDSDRKAPRKEKNSKPHRGEHKDKGNREASKPKSHKNTKSEDHGKSEGDKKPFIRKRRFRGGKNQKGTQEQKDNGKRTENKRNSEGRGKDRRPAEK